MRRKKDGKDRRIRQQTRDDIRRITEDGNYAEAIIATMRQPLLLLDEKFRIKTANTAFYKTFQVSKQGTLDRLIYDLGNEQWNIPALRILLEKILPERRSFSDFEVNHNFQSIGKRTMLLNGHEIIRERSKEKLILLAIEDVTERKQAESKLQESEAQFRQMADLMPDKVINADAVGSIIYYNQSWMDYTGLSFEELTGQGWEKFMHPDELEEFTKQWLHSIETGHDLEMEHRCLNKNGEYKWHLSRVVAVKDDKGKTKTWIGTTTEIQKIKEEEQRKDDFLKMVSHELKTPVTSIKGYVQLLLSTLTDEQETQLGSLPLKSSLLRMDKQIVRLTRLIAEILDLSRIKEDKLELKKQLFSLNELVVETIQDINQAHPKHTINITHDFNCDISGDKDRIRQVIINFITNAIKYSPDGDKIDVSIQKTEKNRVAVSVKDHGIGIDKKDHKNIFKRFYRVGQHEHAFTGFGIGLYLANEIIQRHNGFITVDSKKGKGSVFTFVLPFENNAAS